MRGQQVIDGVLIDEENVERTVEYSRTHNRFNRDASSAEVRERLMQEAFKELHGPSFQPGHMVQAYDAWFVIDEFPKGTLFNAEPAQSNPPRYELNFFVRLGRQPNMSAIES